MSKSGTAAPIAALMLGLSCCGSSAQTAGLLASPYAQLETPTERDTPALSADERKKLRDELTKARDRQNDRVKAKESGQAAKSNPPPKSKKP